MGGLLARFTLYRSTALEEDRSPGELFQGRRLRTRLPDFCPGPCEQALRRQPRQSLKRKPLPELQKHAVVRIRGGTWDRKARVMDLVAPRSYRVATEILRRNRQHLLATHESFQSDLGDDYSESDEVTPATLPERSPPSQTTPMVSSFQGTAAAPQCTVQPTQALPSRSTRPRPQPSRLHYDRHFKQVSYLTLNL